MSESADTMEPVNVPGSTNTARMFFMIHRRMMELQEKEDGFEEAIEIAEQLLLHPDLPMYIRARCLMVLSCNPAYPETAVQSARHAVKLLDVDVRELVTSRNGQFPQKTLDDAKRLLKEAEEDYEAWLEELRIEKEEKKLKSSDKKTKIAVEKHEDTTLAESSAAEKTKNEPVVESNDAEKKENEQVAKSSATSVQQTGDPVAETARRVARLLKDEGNVFAGAGTPPRSARKGFGLSPAEIAASPILQQTLQRSHGITDFRQALEKQARGQPAYLTPQRSNASQIEIPGDEEQEKSQGDRDGDESMD